MFRQDFVPMSAKLIRLRYPAVCAGCEAALAASTDAWWDADARTATCLECVQPPSRNDPAPNAPAATPEIEVAPEAPAPLMNEGEAGGSARREYEKRHERREAEIERRWGRLAGIVKLLSDDPQSITAWAKGSEGERRLAETLTRRVGDRAVLLHDRKVPGTRGNIDHLAVAASGVWVIDAKSYRGLVKRRDVGGLLRTDYRVYVGRRDRTAVTEGLGWQVDAVRAALGGVDVPVHAVVCFVDAEWRAFAKPFEIGGVWVLWRDKLAEMIASPGPLELSSVKQIGGHLASGLPAAGRTT
jgi:hypothetical protein